MDEKVWQRLDALENALSRMEARAEIENLMAKHNFYFSAGQGRRIVSELWTKDEAASIEYGASGVYGALWKVRTFYVDFVHPGCFATFTGSNQYLTVAPDGATAHGVWMVLGTETDAGDLAAEKPAPRRPAAGAAFFPHRDRGAVPCRGAASKTRSQVRQGRRPVEDPRLAYQRVLPLPGCQRLGPLCQRTADHRRHVAGSKV